ncbi:MAG: ADOP family duplicated permease [Vicinamibacterales bacterium]
MTRVRVLLSRLLDVLLRRRREQRLAEEVQAHLDLLAEEYVRRGLSPADARFAARKAFGGVDQIKERYRDRRGLPSLDTLMQDTKYAVRQIARDRWVTAAAVIALSLGIGMSTMMLSVLYGMNLRALPFEDADAIVVAAGERNRTQGGRLPMPVFEAWRDGSRSFVGIAGEVDAPANLGDDNNNTDQFGGTFISHNVFSILGVRPILGRDFRPDDDHIGGPLAVIIGHRVWTDRYGSALSVIGRAVKVNGEPAVVIGVMPEGFMYPVETQIWRPLSSLPAPPTGQETVRVLAKLKDGVSAEQARDELAAIASTLDTVPEADRRRRTQVVPLNEAYFGATLQPVPLMMLVAVFVVLVIGCSHAANLLLTRSAARSREISLKAALGAGRGRIVRQLLLESVLMAMLAGAAGFAIAYVGVQRIAAEVQGFGMPYWARFTFDLRLFSFFAMICLGTGVVFGLVPAWHTSRANLSELLNQAGRSGSITRRTRLTSTLLVAELALTLILLSTAFLLVKSAGVVYRDDNTMDVASLWQFRVSLPQPRYASLESRQQFYQQLDAHLRAASGFESAAIGSAPPFARSDAAPILMDTVSDVAQARSSRVVSIGLRYFETLGLRLRRGTSLDELDPARRSASALVNQRFVETFSKDAEPIGRRVGLVNERDPKAAPEWFTISGIAPSIRHSPASGQQPVVYLPHEVRASASGTIVIRGNPAAFAEVVRQEVRRIDPDLPVYSLLSLARLSEMSRWIPRITSTVMSILAVIAVVLSALGLYAITAYHASQRTKEVGVRMALGSRASQVSWLFLKSALMQLAIGLAIGIPGALAAGQLIQGALIQTSASDPFTIASVSGLLIVIAVAASLLPARKASRLDPVVALRQD